MVTANFFWHGSDLSLYEAACLSSFVNRGFDARLHSFRRDLVVPRGVQLIDARALADESEVLRYTQDTQGGRKVSVAAFSNIFRYRLFQKKPGWWFDADVICLADADAFAKMEKLSKGILVGEEDRSRLNDAVLFLSNPEIAVDLEEMANRKGFNLKWGAIGPQLITEFRAGKPDCVTVMPQQTFYPIHWHNEWDKILDPDEYGYCADRTRNAACVHLWNEFFRVWGIPKNIMPCEGSYLNELFSQVVADTDRMPALPIETFRALQANAQIGRTGRRILRYVEWARQLKRNCGL